ncbi:MAG: sigma 54-interacting transcriptional regulator [Desulfomonilaceae bacterium]|nr:sigma 54-interacting transcriptional regulator [Desulfomonilaceae bacterium]
MSKPNRILVVDDEQHNLDLLEAMLESLGYHSVLARDGDEALSLLTPEIDLVLLDVMLPGIDGYETARRIREHPEYGYLPIIMVTALKEREDKLRAAEAGANDFISKPIEKVELRIRVASLLKMKEAQDIVRRHRAELEETVTKRTAALRESEERFRTVFEAAQDSIFLKNTDLQYTHVNPAMLRLLDVSIDDIAAKTDDDLFPEEPSRKIRDLELRVLAGQSIETEQTIVANHVPMTISCARVPMRNSLGEVIGICGIARDVTERRVKDVERTDQADEYPSEAMRSTLKQIRLAAGTDALVLFLGESGSGKDYLAWYLHDHSNRADGPFFSINCAALAPELAESELFGHESGAFTGSRGRKRGLLELAEGGTLLLNEIGDLLPQLQAKLLTFLDTQSFTRVGGEKNVSVNARIVAATNRDLEREAELGSFRKDLFYRLNVFSIRVPPLRERIEDLPLIVRNLSESLAEKMGLQEIPVIDGHALTTLRNYHWPGNVRELRNVMERALILCRNDRIGVNDINLIGKVDCEDSLVEDSSFSINLTAGMSMTDVLQEAKTWMVSEGLRLSGGSVKDASALLGISRDQMKYLMKTLRVRR